MQNTHNEEQIDAWLEQTTRNMSSRKIVAVFSSALTNFSRKASRSLNRLTLMAIVNRVLYQCKDHYPLLQGVRIDNTGFNFDQYKYQLEQAAPEELKESFRNFFIELFCILGDLTADVIHPVLEENSEEVFSIVKTTEDDKACSRLDSLYEISRLFAAFESVEKTFPEIFLTLTPLFSFNTITLLEKKHDSTVTTVWHDPSVEKECRKKAVEHARHLFEYLVCPLEHDCQMNPQEFEHALPNSAHERGSAQMNQGNRYITLPLSLSNLETFGVLQFECIGPMLEADLRFLNALTNLIAVTLDRFNKEQESEFIHQSELSKRSRELDDAHQYATKLEKERELREQFVATLTHDLRTPLTAAKIGAQFILRRPDKIEKNQQLAIKIIRSIDRMDQMVKDLLDASRIRAGESLALTMNECDLREVALMTLRELGAAYGDRFILETERETIAGYWNEDGLRRVIENLASNAVKYGFPQQLITVSLKQNAKTVQIIVHNFGNPIPKDDQERLFEPFQRSHSIQSNSKKGWGLGLTLVRGVVEAHGGHVNVTSDEREGTNFIVTLPKDSRPFQVLH
jgi:signal transduction histidine kinase